MQTTQDRKQERYLVLLVLAGVALIYLLTASRQPMNDANNDVSGAAFAAWQIADSGAPWVDDGTGRLVDSMPQRVEPGFHSGNGRQVIGRSPGVVAAGVPASWVWQLFGAGFGPGPQLVSATLLSVTSVALLYLALRRDLGLALSLLVSGTFALATPVWSVNANALWTHVVTVLGITGMAWAAKSDRWWLVGLFGGLTLWGRLHAALIVAVVGVWVAVARRRPVIALKIGTASTAALGLASLWSWWQYGSWIPSGGYGGGAATFVLSASPGGESSGVLASQAGIWVAPACGLLIWTPVLVLVLPGALRRHSQIPDWAKGLAISGLLYTVIQAQINFAGGTGFYGYRHGIEFIASVTPAIAYSLRGTSSRLAKVAYCVVAVQFAAIAVGAIFDGGFIAAERAWRANGLVEVFRVEVATGVLAFALALTALAVRHGLAQAAQSVDASPLPSSASSSPRVRG